MFRLHRLLYALSILILAATNCAVPPSQTATETPSPVPTSDAIPLASLGEDVTDQAVTFQSDGLTLVGFLSKPAGEGPFPR